MIKVYDKGYAMMQYESIIKELECNNYSPSACCYALGRLQAMVERIIKEMED